MVSLCTIFSRLESLALYPAPYLLNPICFVPKYPLALSTPQFAPPFDPRAPAAGSVSTQPIASATATHAFTSKPEQQDSAASLVSHPSFKELEECLKHFPTIKVLASNKKMPVVLVYGERTHRKSHRFQDKGKSNTVIYPKEKRDFLRIMGLPGKMITSKGIDFSVKPEIDSSGVRIHYSPQRSRSASTDDHNLKDDKENNGSIMETVLDSTNRLAVSEEDHSQEKTKRRMSAINIIKKQSVGPHPDCGGGGGSGKKSSGKKSKGKIKEKLLPPEDVDVRSMLSCDSCSSNEDDDKSESDICEHDIAVPSNYSHQRNLQPEPFYGLDLTYITLELEKIGVHDTRNLISPFIRMSIRDKEGDLVEGTSVQESSVGEIINKNYLRMEGSIYIQLALQALPDDIAVFLELVHHRAHLNCLSTHCYTFLEKELLKDGEFICELYNPPIDFSRQKFKPYSEKALFLHMKLLITNG
ncbi:Axin interactor dorsalization-associated protein C-terminal domain [Trinorchestia longiramus]|nr:Axin interactor dorsalization-associated protein C-terminal domain [Trinorchestia longiramus]